LILEVNSAPGIEGIEQTTGISVTEPIVEYIEKMVSARKSNRAVIA
jgi:ribosomal protein S6--L-glutamate ligase